MSITRKLFVSAALFALVQVQAGYSEGYSNQVGPRNKSASNSNSRSSASAVVTQSSDYSPEEIQRLSEAFGNFIGRNLKTPAVQFDLDSMIRGIRNGANGKPSPLTDQEYEQAMARLQQVAFKRLAEENLQSANNFMTQNAKKSGIVQLEPQKLQYLIIQQGKGAAVQERSTPQIRYKGSFIDGTVFSNSDEIGGPIAIPLDQTVPGFKRGLVGMKEGEKRVIFVHPDLGYGTTGQLPPNALLIFEVEVVKADAQQNNSPANNKSATTQTSLTPKISAYNKTTANDGDDDDFDDDDDDDAEDNRDNDGFAFNSDAEEEAYDGIDDEDDQIADAYDSEATDHENDDDDDDDDDDDTSHYYYRHR